MISFVALRIEKRNFTFVLTKKKIMAFKLPQLPYAYDALAPHIDAKTMEIHHGKHHGGYTTKLNAALEGSEMENDSIENILKKSKKERWEELYNLCSKIKRCGEETGEGCGCRQPDRYKLDLSLIHI